MLDLITKLIGNGFYRHGFLPWGLRFRAAEVLKNAADDVRAPKLCFSASSMHGLPVTVPSKDYVHAHDLETGNSPKDLEKPRFIKAEGNSSNKNRQFSIAA